MMKRFRLGLSAVALLSALAACGPQAPSENVAANDMNAIMADPNNPFAQSEMAMDQALAAAVGVNAADSWVKKMIEHHRGAVAMSRVLLKQNPSPDAAMMARQTIEKQSREIADLEKLAASGNPDPASAELYRPAATQMRAAMMAATGADVSETYLRKMLAHHQGAVAMSDIALANGASGAIRAQIEKTKADQQKEAAMVEAMLRGEPIPTAPPPASAPTASPPAAKQTAPKPAPVKPAPVTPKPEPAAEPKAPAPTCLPEHRAAGHC
ncbi:MAG TPA: DUF305 domain-containing protein [Sphingomicrobium sp.]|nr:DUF305 domain-containing protein [Sphingomicrobium sp.]